MTVNGIDVPSYQSTSYGTGGLGFVFVNFDNDAPPLKPRPAGGVECLLVP